MKPLFNMFRAEQGQAREHVQGICGARKAGNEGSSPGGERR